MDSSMKCKRPITWLLILNEMVAYGNNNLIILTKELGIPNLFHNFKHKHPINPIICFAKIKFKEY